MASKRDVVSQKKTTRSIYMRIQKPKATVAHCLISILIPFQRPFSYSAVMGFRALSDDPDTPKKGSQCLSWRWSKAWLISTYPHVFNYFKVMTLDPIANTVL